MASVTVKSKASGAVVNRETDPRAFLPYARHVTEHVVALDTQALMISFQLDGASFETADVRDLNDWHAKLNSAWRNLADDQLAIWTHLIRREHQGYPAGDFRSDFAAGLDHRYRARLGAGRMFVNELYVTLVLHPGREVAERAAAWFSRRASSAAAEHDDALLKRIEDAVAFIQESSESSPDLQCHDPFPLVIECKRQDPLSNYELEEEAVMRSLFVQLRALARAMGLTGVFELRLTVEAKDLDAADVCATMLRQRLAPRPERPLAYALGSVAYRERPPRLWLPEVTRAYSPTMLEQVFGWTMDLPQWDGLCCSIDNARDGSVLDVRNALGVLWSNESRAALRKRTWAPTNLFGSATKQIYGGSMGIIYVAYVEGAREEAADLRVSAYGDRLADWEHAGDIRVPISVLCRLYPRPLGEGAPDLIESGVRLLSAAYGDPALFDDFPTTILTCSGRD